MESTAPRRDGKRKEEARAPSASELAGGLVALVALSVVFGWLTRWNRLVQLHPSLAPMQFNTALGLFLCGAAHLSLPRSRRWSSLAALAAIGLGLSTGIQYVLGLDLGIDELFLRHDLTVKTSSPGRMAPAAAAALVLSGSAVLLAGGSGARRSSSWTALAGTTLVGIGSGTLLGYAAGFEIPYGWKDATYVALHTAVATSLLGAAALERAVRAAGTAEGIPRWTPWCAGWLVVTLTVGLAHALWATERSHVETTLSSQLLLAANEVTKSVEPVAWTLEHLARRWADEPPDPSQVEEARLLIDDTAAIALLRASAPGKLQWIVSRAGAPELSRLELEETIGPGLLASGMLDVTPGVRGLALVAPMKTAGAVSGYLAAIVDAPGLVSRLSVQARRAGYGFALLEGSRVLFEQGDSKTSSRTMTLPIADADLRLRISQGGELAASPSTALPAGVLGGGAIVALLLGLATHFGQVSASRERALERAASELGAEVDERRRAESALRGHREQLERVVVERTRELMEANVRLRLENAERRKAEDEAHRRADQLDVIHGLVRIITASADVREIYVNLVEVLSRLVPYDASSLVALDEDRERFWIEAEWDGEALLPTGGEPAPVAGSALAPVVEASRALVARGPLVGADAARDESIRTLLYLPLTVEGEILGVLTLQSRDANAYPTGLVDALSPIASQLAIALEKARLYQRLRRYAGELEGRVAARTAELETAVRELEAFSYSVSHDLRAPLRHASGFVDLLRRHAGDELDETSRRYLHIIEESTTRMGRLIDDLLSFSRIGRRELEMERVPLRDVISSVLAELEPETKDRDIDFTLGELPEVRADASLLRLVLTNLVANAIKFTRCRERACIEIGAASSDEETVVFVTDNGVGFDMKYREKLFRVFQRLHRAEEFEGTGIGLANASRIVHRHGGRIWAQSCPGEGARFYFSIPRKSQEDAIEPAEPHPVGRR